MALAPSGPKQQTNPYLTAGQRDLLLVALNSQASQPQAGVNGANTVASEHPKLEDNGTMSASSLFQSPDMDGYDFDAEYDDVDFDGADLGGEMIGALPGHGEQHDKRNHPDEEDDAEEGDAKRQETQEGERGAKKPGRKPLTNEPTTKRKAQNRAAQRAFRERKERHLKDLETKVNEMSKAHEADKHENGMLKAQVDRLQVELKEYRKRLSLGGSVSRSPPMQPSLNRNNSNGNAQKNFQFDFPKFGELPGSQIFGNQNGSGSSISSQRHSITPPILTQSPVTGYIGANQPPPLTREGSSHGSVQSINLQGINGTASHSQSPTAQQSSYLRTNPDFAPYSTNDNMHGFASTLPQMNAIGTDPFGDLFSPSVLKAAGQAENYFATGQQRMAPTAAKVNGGDSTAGIPDSRVFRFNSTSNTSDTASPSASSLSQWNMNGTTNSSCGTSPEPTHDSPANKDKAADTFDHSFNQNAYMDNAFMSQPLSSSNLATFSTSNLDNTYSLPQLESFDPVLFGDYRESQDNILGGGDFTGGFFDDALNTAAPYDYGSPSNLFGILQTLPKPMPSPSNMINAPTPSRNLMAEVDKARNGGDEDYGLPTQQAASKKSPDSSTKLISCNNIWNQLQSNPDFQDGKFDLDGLCSELRSKARCSESGVMVDQDHVDKALKKLSKKGEDGKPPKEVENMPPLLFEQDSWDRVLQKLGSGTV
ncbi:hypothetical protein B0A48_15677 [Cryoendolithus antarcticus]|uniref:BZIP domain-containing protein n=1 Tax=Cryoendolithus antarcticus TaxID=1507870 RepID=A0A1V8SGY2_9PEZI|nr:hypothetical protein B0A48_15677 [Cryoendolithus antarcticus]